MRFILDIQFNEVPEERKDSFEHEFNVAWDNFVQSFYPENRSWSFTQAPDTIWMDPVDMEV